MPKRDEKEEVNSWMGFSINMYLQKYLLVVIHVGRNNMWNEVCSNSHIIHFIYLLLTFPFSSENRTHGSSLVNTVYRIFQFTCKYRLHYKSTSTIRMLSR